MDCEYTGDPRSSDFEGTLLRQIRGCGRLDPYRGRFGKEPSAIYQKLGQPYPPDTSRHMDRSREYDVGSGEMTAGEPQHWHSSVLSRLSNINAIDILLIIALIGLAIVCYHILTFPSIDQLIMRSALVMRSLPGAK